MRTAKYKLTEETINVNGITLYRIEALKDFSDVKKGDNGGFLEKEDNLSQSGDCWVYGNAKVYDNAVVYGNAVVFGNAEVYDYAKVCGNAVVYCEAKVYGNTIVYGNAEVFGNAKVYDYAKVCGNAVVYCEAKVYGNAIVFGNAEIRGDAVITSKSDYILFKNWWSSGRFFTWTRSNNMWKVGCFYGTGEELIEEAYEDGEKTGEEYERVVKYVEAILKANKL